MPIGENFAPGSLLAEQEQEQKDLSLTDYYKSVSVTTYALALSQATGTQKKIITVTADSDSSKNGKYFYDGVAGVIANSIGGATVSGKLRDISFSADVTDRAIAVSPSGSNSETAMVQEPTVWYYNGLYHMIYTGGQGNSQYLYYASAASIDGTWTKNGAAVIGGGAAGHATGAYHSSVYLEGSNLWCYFVDVADNTLLKVATASANTPSIWTKISTTYALPSGMTLWGNVCVFKDASTYHFLGEGSTAAASWQMMYGTLAGSPIGALTAVTNPITQLRPSAGNANATVSGPALFKEDGLFVLYYHCGRSSSLPTEIYRATSPDMTTWTIDNNGYPIVDRVHPSEVDQVSDPSVVQDALTGTYYLFYTAMDNTKPAANVMRLKGLPASVDSQGKSAGVQSWRNPKITEPQKKAAVQLSSNLSVTSTSFVDTGLSINFIPRGTAILVTLAGVGSNSAVTNNFFQVTDGGGGANTKPLGGYTPSAGGVQFAMSGAALITGLNPGQRYSFRLQCKVASGTFSCRATSFPAYEMMTMIIEDAEWPLRTA